MAHPSSTSVALWLVASCMAVGAAGLQDQLNVTAGGTGASANATASLNGTSSAAVDGQGSSNINATENLHGTASAPVGGHVGSNGTGNATTGQGTSGGDGVFDVVDYGAVADGTTENSKAFLDAWQAACAYQGISTFLVPKGTFLVGPVTFRGPCLNNSLTQAIIKGTLKALPDPRSYSSVRWVEFYKLHVLTVKGRGTLDGQGSKAWGSNTCKRHRHCRNLPTTLRFAAVNNATVTDLNLVDSKGFHLNIHRCANIEARFLNITAPGHSPNTDGIHISGTHNINITHVNISTGDDCISIGAGTTDVKIANITCGPGHGISVGSLGKYNNEKDVSNVRVRNCTLSGTTNGLRIKTWPAAPPSKAANITFEDIVLNNVSHPIIIDQQYCPVKKCKTEPSLVKLEGIAFRRVRGTSRSEVAVHMVCSESSPCEDVQLEDVEVHYVEGEATSTCANVKASFFGSQKPTPCI